MIGLIDTRTCSVCIKEKPLTEFYTYKSPWSGKPMWTRKCKVCQTAYRQARRSKDRAKYNQQSRAKRRGMKLRAVEYKGDRCVDCNQQWPLAVYEFHHLDPKEKERSPGNMLGRKWENLMPELDKCVLLCANCHRVRHSYTEDFSV